MRYIAAFHSSLRNRAQPLGDLMRTLDALKARGQDDKRRIGELAGIGYAIIMSHGW